jgi:hypothetical protein
MQVEFYTVTEWNAQMVCGNVDVAKRSSTTDGKRVD